MNQKYLQGLSSDMESPDDAVFFEATPENITAFLMQHQRASMSVIGTVDSRAFLTAKTGLIDTCPDQRAGTDKTIFSMLLNKEIDQMHKTTKSAMAYPYTDRSMWLYSRSSDKRMFVLIQQMRNLLEEANHREYTVVGASQDMGAGRSMAHMGLKQMMRSVRGGFVRAVLVRDLSRLSHDPAILIQILEFLQDHGAVLITTESDLWYELYIKGLENRFFQRAAQKSLHLPW